jgi:hypothetical protein
MTIINNCLIVHVSVERIAPLFVDLKTDLKIITKFLKGFFSWQCPFDTKSHRYNVLVDVIDEFISSVFSKVTMYTNVVPIVFDDCFLSPMFA